MVIQNHTYFEVCEWNEVQYLFFYGCKKVMFFLVDLKGFGKEGGTYPEKFKL